MQAVRVLVVDDHPVVRDGMAAAINYQVDIAVIATAGNGREAVDMFRLHRPDVTLMDLRMPEMNGVEAITIIRSEFPSARIVVLTTFEGDEDIYRGLRAGALGYVLKDATIEEILAAVRTVNLGKKYVPQNVAAKLVERAYCTELTNREVEVLVQMAKGSPNQNIAANLSIAEGTVKTHVSSILTKLDVGDRTQAVTEALRRGILHLE